MTNDQLGPEMGENKKTKKKNYLSFHWAICAMNSRPYKWTSDLRQARWNETLESRGLTLKNSGQKWIFQCKKDSFDWAMTYLSAILLHKSETQMNLWALDCSICVTFSVCGNRPEIQWTPWFWGILSFWTKSQTQRSINQVTYLQVIVQAINF